MSSAIDGFLANAAIAWLPAGTPRYNIVIADGEAERTFRILLRGNAAALDYGRSLASNTLVDQDDVDPRKRFMNIKIGGKIKVVQVLRSMCVSFVETLFCLMNPTLLASNYLSELKLQYCNFISENA